ncbi:MAG: peptide ABC transporter ATP-binding protein [Candidatus Marinimicrobia bacterium]|nr:peptide ABC transporter ATP-binding protein [Candidatus Neomarinimicrobiota bacterium]
MNNPILQIKNLKTYFHTDNGIAHAVDNVSFNLNSGETLGIVGESGCGKSVTSLSIMKLIDQPPGFYESGEILYKNQNILTMSENELRGIRGNKISMIFQEPMTSLNPVFTIGNQIIEVVQLHQKLNYDSSRKKAIEMLDLVGIPAPDQRIDEYPHQLSGGMRQRVMIAIALSCNPEILIADEPTTALDVTIQAQILDLIQQLQNELDLAVIMITHDLGVIAEVCDRVLVMYAGQIVENGKIREIFKSPKHPYTQGLMKSIPVIGENKNKELFNIKGLVPNATEFPSGCHFNPRCEIRTDKCSKDLPMLEALPNNENHLVRCWEA